MAADNQASEWPDTGNLVFGPILQKETFTQILEMDDPGSHDFSKTIVYDFFTQAEDTFEKIDKALAKQNLDDLSALGHFLKGSSATLGFVKVQESCEKIQRYGKRENLDGTPGLSTEVCLANIKQVLGEVKTELGEVRMMLDNFYKTADGDD